MGTAAKRVRRWTPLVGVLVLLVTGVPGPAQAETVQEARAEAARLSAHLADLRERSASAIHLLEEAEHELGVAVGRSATLAQQLDDARALAGGSDRQLSRRVSALYRSEIGRAHV